LGHIVAGIVKSPGVPAFVNCTPRLVSAKGVNNLSTGTHRETKEVRQTVRESSKREIHRCSDIPFNVIDEKRVAVPTVGKLGPSEHLLLQRFGHIKGGGVDRK
jgi:hypothetical protein